MAFTSTRRNGIAAATVLLGIATLSAGLTPATAAEPEREPAAHSSCEMGNGVQHVISMVFDNVHFSRDNPNVPSDLEQMPHLLNFLTVQRHGAVQHAHAADRAHRR